MDAFFTTATTGCSCCRHENRIFGPFSTLIAAQTQRDRNNVGTQFASQYAAHGCHSISKADAEQLGDGRIVIGDRIFPSWADEAFDAELGHPDKYFGLDDTTIANA